MTDYIYPLSAVVLSFLALLLCIRNLALKRGLVWLLPLLQSIIMLCASAVCLLVAASDIAGPTLSTLSGYVALFLFILAVIWIITIIALGKAMDKGETTREDQWAYNEAQYVKFKTSFDKRPTKASEIEDLEEDKVKKDSDDPYDNGPVATRKTKPSIFKT